MRTACIALLAALAALPAAAYAADVQFHIVTEAGNTFLIEPPDLPRPANIIGETAHLAVRNPPAGMFVATSHDGAAHKFTPLQSGLDMAGFDGGTVRIILRSDWDLAGDRTFRDQAFGTMTGDPMRHHSAMPLAPNWNDTYDMVSLRDNSCFGLGYGCTNNTLGLTGGSLGEYAVPMGGRERAGLDFGPGTGSDQTYYIYRGCSSCGALAAIGHGDPTDRREALPNDRSVTNHDRGWRSTGSCGASDIDTWSGRGSRTISDTYGIPPPAHSRAGGHYIDSRYADLSVLPGSHSLCSGTMYTENNDDNRKHDMCVSGTSASASTRHSYPYTKTVRTETYLNGTQTGVTTTTTSGSTTRTTTGSCNALSLSGTADGYRVSAYCSGGPSPTNPPSDSTTYSSTGDLNAGTITRTTIDYSSPSVTTTGRVSASCSLHTNTPHLDLEDAMTIQPGLNVYRPPAIPASHHIIIIYDDAENGGGGNEIIQVFRHDGPGPDPAGPYSFHLRPSTQGILYDAHRHYGWVDTRTYDAGQLSRMGYTAHSAMAGHGDGLRADGGHPYMDGTRICHGDCLMGMEGIDGGKPAIRTVDAATSRAASMHDSVTYDHHNGEWFESIYGTDGLVTAATLYLVVPFAEDAILAHVWLYDDDFDPALQDPSPRDNPGSSRVCHIHQAGRFGTFASAVNVTDGDALHIPILPGMRYAAFVGNGDCYWYDITSLPSPLSSVASGARHVPLANGTVLSGDLTARRDGTVHVDVVADLEAMWQLEAYGIGDGTTPANAAWTVPPLEVEVTAVARVNGAYGPCGAAGVYCSEPIRMAGAAAEHGAYIHDASFQHGLPYAEAPVPLPSGGLAGTGVYGLPDGRCYGLEGVSAATGGLVVRDIPHMRVLAGDAITLSFNATAHLPEVAGGNVTMVAPAGHACRLVESVQTATLDIRTMTATLR